MEMELEKISDDYRFYPSKSFASFAASDTGDAMDAEMEALFEEVLPGIFWSPYAINSTNNLQSLKAAGISNKVCVTSNIASHARPDAEFTTLFVQVTDSSVESIIPKVKTVSLYVDGCMKFGGKVLIHGDAGVFCSAAILVGTVMARYCTTFKKAKFCAQGNRFRLSLSDRFAEQLQKYEYNQDSKGVDTGNWGWSLKRGPDYEHDDQFSNQKYICSP